MSEQTSWHQVNKAMGDLQKLSLSRLEDSNQLRRLLEMSSRMRKNVQESTK